jgi:uncharacterized OB-fold protein
VPVSGQGRLHRFTIVYQLASAACKDDAPHVYTAVQLDEGPRMVSHVVQCNSEAVRVDMPLVAGFDDVTLQGTLEKCKPACGPCEGGGVEEDRP